MKTKPSRHRSASGLEAKKANRREIRPKTAFLPPFAKQHKERKVRDSRLDGLVVISENLRDFYWIFFSCQKVKVIISQRTDSGNEREASLCIQSRKSLLVMCANALLKRQCQASIKAGKLTVGR